MTRKSAATTRETQDRAADLEARIQRLFKRSQFDDELLGLVESLSGLVKEFRPEDPAFLKRRCLIAEIMDHEGRTQEARRAVQEAPMALPQLTPGPTVTPGLRRERIRLATDFARIYYYREHKYSAARQLLLQCLQAVSDLASEDFPCFGTRAQVNYYLGCAHRQLGDYESADTCYGEAIRFYRERAGRVLATGRATTERGLDDMVFARHRTGVCMGLGLGWVNYTRGFLREALIHDIQPAEVLLQDSKDRVDQASLQLLRGSIERCLAGSDQAQLARAIRTVADAKRTFASHEPYLARASFELALCRLYANQLDAAGREIDQILSIAHNRRDLMWQCNAWIVRSRLLRRQGDLEGALTEAEHAEQAAGQDAPVTRIDALIAKGEALLDQHHAIAAREAFESARGSLRRPHSGSLAAASPKIEGVLAVHTGRTYLLENNLVRVEECLREWERHAPLVQHRSVHELADRLRNDLRSRRMDFTLGQADRLDYQRHHAALRRWLIRTAAQRGLGKSETARELGISRQTLHSWETELRDQPDPAFAQSQVGTTPTSAAGQRRVL